MANKINLTLKIWRQTGPKSKGKFEIYKAPGVDIDMSFLELLDVVNQDLTKKGIEPIAFDHDCREGICGMCSAMINGQAHGPLNGTTVCQLHLRHFKNNDTIVVEPWRSKAFPVVKDLVVDRSSFDRVIASGGYVSVKTGPAPEANSMPVAKDTAEAAMDAAACIGCGACVAACPNASAMLFVGAKVTQLSLLPQGQIEREGRVLSMVKQMDAEGFGNCSNVYECEAACPKEIRVANIAHLNREYRHAHLAHPDGP